MLADIHGDDKDGFVSCLVKPQPGLGLRDLDRVLVKLHSTFTRLSAADRFGRVRCFTCNQAVFWKYSHAGHFVPRGKLPTKFVDKNVHPQCERCNMMLAGKLEVYRMRLDNRYGAGTADGLIKLSKSDFRPSREWYLGKIAKYKCRIKALKSKL